jgi:hypothetical protein
MREMGPRRPDLEMQFPPFGIGGQDYRRSATMEIIPGVHTIDSLSMGRAYLAVDADRLTITQPPRTRSA